MTRLTYILLFIPFLGLGQIDPAVLPLLNEWKNEARKNDVYVDGIIAKHLGGVKFVTAEQMEMLKRVEDTSKVVPAAIIGREVKRGLYNYIFIAPVIYIQEIYKGQENSLKFIIWHELYHFLGGKGHHEKGITAKHIDWIDWSQPQPEYWQRIKELPTDGYWKRNDNTYY